VYLRDHPLLVAETAWFSSLGVNHVIGATIDGKSVHMWWRPTTRYREIREIKAEWMIAHEHNSVPFDVESSRASLDRKQSVPLPRSGRALEVGITVTTPATQPGCAPRA
jgi:hypothetical protein